MKDICERTGIYFVLFFFLLIVLVGTRAYSEAPAAPGLLSPSRGAKLFESKVTLSWNIASAASSYQVAVRKGGDKKYRASKEWVSSTSFQMRAARGAVHYWRVRGKDAMGVLGKWSKESFFYVTEKCIASLKPKKFVFVGGLLESSFSYKKPRSKSMQVSTIGGKECEWGLRLESDWLEISPRSAHGRFYGPRVLKLKPSVNNSVNARQMIVHIDDESVQVQQAGLPVEATPVPQATATPPSLQAWHAYEFAYTNQMEGHFAWKMNGPFGDLKIHWIANPPPAFPLSVVASRSSARPDSITYPGALGMSYFSDPASLYSGWITVPGGVGCAGVLPVTEEEGKLFVQLDMADANNNHVKFVHAWYCRN